MIKLNFKHYKRRKRSSLPISYYGIQKNNTLNYNI